MKAANLGDNPILDTKDPDLPVGLKVCLHAIAQLKCSHYVSAEPWGHLLC
jgi:hypothetical protein